MHKGNIKQNLNTIKIGISEIYKLQPWVLPVTMFDALFESISPFINIYMSARIIDELVESRSIDKLIFLVAVTIGLNLIVHLISTGLNHLKTILEDMMDKSLKMRLNECIIDMDYKYVESAKVHSLLTKIEEARNMNGGGIERLELNIGRLTSGSVTVITSIILVINLFKPNPIAAGRQIIYH
jgi:ATP-binding cassette subfamily B protein